MALQSDVKFNGSTISGAYTRVVMPCIRVDKKSMSFVAQSSGKAGGDLISAFDSICAYDIDGENPFSQAYSFLKTLPDFEGATDC